MAAPGQAARPYRWCRECGEPVKLAPGNGQPWDRKAVHSATGLTEGPDGHFAAAVAEDPALRRQADAIEARYHMSVSVRFGFFRADRTDIVTPVHFEADEGEGLDAARVPRRTAP